ELAPARRLNIHSPVVRAELLHSALRAEKVRTGMRLAHAASRSMIEMQMVIGLASWLAVLVGGVAAPVGVEPRRQVERIDDAEFVVVPAPARPVHADDVTVRVLVEKKYADEADAFAWAVEEALGDEHGWAAAGHRFVLVDG